MNFRNFVAPIPEVADSAKSFVDVGNECVSCERNTGMFPIADICRYCRKQDQANGDTITAIAVFSGGDGKRLPNDSIKLDENGNVSIMKGPHKDITWLNGAPNLEKRDTFFFGPFVYRVRFENR